MNITFYQIAGDQPGTSIYINPLHVVKVVPNGQNDNIHLSDKSIYAVAQIASAIKTRLQECMT